MKDFKQSLEEYKKIDKYIREVAERYSEDFKDSISGVPDTDACWTIEVNHLNQEVICLSWEECFRGEIDYYELSILIDFFIDYEAAFKAKVEADKLAAKERERKKKAEEAKSKAAIRKREKANYLRLKKKFEK